jgi:adenine-specific DNA-methyltransferase
LRYDVRKGFVYRRVPHVTLKSIANNEEIDEIHARWQEELEPLRAEINRLAGKTFEEWELPREPDPAWPAATGEALARWWALRRKRQQEIDASIARRADQDLLYDQSYEDPKRVRVAGPFTVESLSPHRVLSTDEERPESEQEAARDPAGGQFELTTIENLKKAGVQNSFKDQRIRFDRLEPYAGEWIQAAGEYTDAEGPMRVAVSIGPEYGTVGPEQIREAAKEAVRGLGFGLLLVCGFAFDAHASETAKEFSDVAGKRPQSARRSTHPSASRRPGVSTASSPSYSPRTPRGAHAGTPRQYLASISRASRNDAGMSPTPIVCSTGTRPGAGVASRSVITVAAMNSPTIAKLT